MERVLFTKGMQRKFLDLVIENLNCLSLRGILQFGFDVKYSSLKNYYTERRLLPKDFFELLCQISKLNILDFDIKYLPEEWGRIKGGKISKRRI